MIRRTIREHLDKEKRLRPQGIKVLSLFFIDAVDRFIDLPEKQLQKASVEIHRKLLRLIIVVYECEAIYSKLSSTKSDEKQQQQRQPNNLINSLQNLAYYPAISMILKTGIFILKVLSVLLKYLKLNQVEGNIKFK
jgi:restriction endonuclease